MAKKAKRELTYGLYAALMEELKIRLRTIDSTLLADKVLHGTINREFCFLQLRMSCEVLALACLVAHGDISATRSLRLQKRYEPDKIMKMLEEIHPDFYPYSVRQVRRSDKESHFDDFDGPILIKEELFRLYGKCGDVLHRGNMKKLLSVDEPLPAHNSDVPEYVLKIWNLLLQHRIALADGRQLLCFLEDSSIGNRAHVWIAEKHSPSEQEDVKPAL